MRFRSRPPGFTRFSVLLLITLATLATFAGEAAAILHRVGPINSDNAVGNYPAWYQDNTGLTLEFCDPKNDNELDGGWCLLTRNNVPPGAPGVLSVPEFFPTNFFDEHFYYSTSAVWPANPLKQLLWESAVEAAFAAGPAIPGDQITFTRIRVRLEDVPVSGTYTFTHPYGVIVVDNAVAGDRIFFTEDVGVALGDFSGALNSKVGPFLLPSNTPGGSELPAVAGPAPGKLYIADPARSGPVTGSPFGPTRNFVRIDGPDGSNLDGLDNNFIQTSDFNLVGRLFTGNIPGEVTVDRAEYARNGAGQKVEVYATGLETTQGRLPAQPPAPSILPVLSFFDAPCTSAFDNNLKPIPPFSAPVGAVETPMFNAANSFWAFVPVNPVPAAVCVKDSVSAAYFLKSVVDEVTINQAYFDPNAQSLSVHAFSSDEIDPPVLTLGALGDLTNGSILVSPLAAPPSHVHVNSSHGGANILQVTTTPPAASAPPPVASVTLVASPVDNTQTGNSVDFIAAATGGSGNYEYQFLIKTATSGTFLVPQTYGVDNSWTWNTTGSPPGVYEVQVYARSVGSVAPLEAINSLVYTLTVPPVSGGTLTPNPVGPVESGTTITFTATASGGSGNYEYEFQARAAGGTFVTPVQYGPINAWAWDSIDAPAGNYDVKVNIRNVGSTAPFEFTTTVPYSLTPNTSAKPSAVTLEANPVDNSATGGTVVFTATVIGGTGPFEYQFLARAAGGTFVVPQPYSALNSWTWNTTGGPPGGYEVMVMVRRVRSFPPAFEVTSTIPYVLTP